jgi:hypothetical protein
VCMKFSEKNTTGIMVYCLSSLCWLLLLLLLLLLFSLLCIYLSSCADSVIGSCSCWVSTLK